MERLKLLFILYWEKILAVLTIILLAILLYKMCNYVLRKDDPKIEQNENLNPNNQ